MGGGVAGCARLDAGRRSVAAAAALAALALLAASSALPGALADSHDIPDVDPAAPQMIAAGSLSHGVGGHGLGRLGDVDVIAINGSAYALAPSIDNDVVHMIRIHDNGTLAPVAVASHGSDGYGRLDGAYGIDTFSMNGTTYAIVVSYYGGGGAQLIRIHDNATMEAVSSIGDNVADRKLNGAVRVAAFSMNGSMYALATAYYDDGVQLIRIHGDGTLEAAHYLSHNSDRNLDGAFGVAVFEPM